MAGDSQASSRAQVGGGGNCRLQHTAHSDKSPILFLGFINHCLNLAFMKVSRCIFLEQAIINEYCYGSRELFNALLAYNKYLLKPERSFVLLGCSRDYCTLNDIAAYFRHIFADIYELKFGNTPGPCKSKEKFYENICCIQEQYLAEFCFRFEFEVPISVFKNIRDILKALQLGDRQRSILSIIKTFKHESVIIRIDRYYDLIEKLDDRKFEPNFSDHDIWNVPTDYSNLWSILKQQLCIYIAAYIVNSKALKYTEEQSGDKFDPEIGYQHTIEFHKLLAHYSMGLCSVVKDAKHVHYLNKSLFLGTQHIERATMDAFKNAATNLSKNNLLSKEQYKILLKSRQEEFSNKSGSMSAKVRAYNEFIKTYNWHGNCLHGSIHVDCPSCCM